MTTEDVSKGNGSNEGQLHFESDEVAKRELETSKNSKIFFWEKWAWQPSNEKDDQLRSFEVVHSPKIREILRNLDSKLLGKKMAFLEEVRPRTSAVKRWIMEIKGSYPNPNPEDVENLLDTFRSSLHSKSKETNKSIVCVLLMEDALLLINCKMDPSLVILDGKLYSVDQILSTKNVYRAAIIRNEEGKTTFSAYEYNKRWSKGHAEFWGIDPEYVAWEALGNITLTIEIENFEYPIQLPIEAKELDLIIKANRITPTGRISLGHITGKILKARIFRTEMSFDDFYQFYINETEQLEVHIKKFNELIPPQKDLHSFSGKHRYKEDMEKIYDKMMGSEEPIYTKEHPTFNVFFFTKSYPGILPDSKVVNSIYDSIFNNVPMNIWHAGEPFSNNPVEIGNLKIFNKIGNKPEIQEFSTNLLNIIQDGRGTKEHYLLQFVFCNFWKYNLEGTHFRTIFDDIYDVIIKRELEFAFKSNGMLAKEEVIDFKSASDVNPKTSKFVNETIMPTVKQYCKDRVLSRNCILYGVSDSGLIEPIYNLKSDQITAIQDMVNKSLTEEKMLLKIDAVSIPYGEGNGRVLALMLIPLI